MTLPETGQKRSRLGQNTLILLASSGSSAVLGFVLTVLIGRATGQAGLGMYAAALAWVYPLALLAEFGLGTLLTRTIAQQPDRMPAILRAAVIWRVLLGGGLMLVVWGAAPSLTQTALLAQGLRLAAPMIVLLPFYGLFTAIFRAHQTMFPIAILNSGMLVAQVGLTGAAFALGGDALAALAINTVTSAGQLVAAWGIYWRRFSGLMPPAPASPLRPVLRGLLGEAMPFAIAAVLAALQLRLALLALEQMTTLTQVGYFAAALKWVEAGRLLPMAFFDALYPRLAELARDRLALRQIFRRIEWGLALTALGLGGGLALAAPVLLTAAFGAAFTPAADTLRGLALALLPLLLKQGRILYGYALGQEQRINGLLGIGVLIQAGALVGWIPAHQAVGAAGAVLLSDTLVWLMLVGDQQLLTRRLRRKPHKAHQTQTR